MRRAAFLIGLCVCCLTVGLGPPARAGSLTEGYAYRYVSLDDAKPPGATFVDYFGLNSTRRVYGNAFTCDEFCDPTIVVYRNGTTTVIHKGVGYAVNEVGVVGGSVVTDLAAFDEQAALFDGAKVQVIPRRPNEATSRVLKLTDSGIALVESLDATTFAPTYSLFTRGRSVELALGPDQVGFLDVNNIGVVAGTFFDGLGGHHRAFRYRPPTSPERLNPLPTEPASYGMAINSQSDVLGYSFVPGGIERIGRWHNGSFITSFVEGTPTVPTISERLLWNEGGLIVITRTSDSRSYIVPRAGVRLNVADLTRGLPAWTQIVDVNNVGDLVGFGGSSFGFAEHAFFLERSGTPQ
jgi:hypothetical protein